MVPRLLKGIMGYFKISWVPGLGLGLRVWGFYIFALKLLCSVLEPLCLCFGVCGFALEPLCRRFGVCLCSFGRVILGLNKHMDCEMKRRGSCSGGRDREKEYVTPVIATTPSKRGRPRKDPLSFVNTNPTSTLNTPLRRSTRLKN